MLQAEPQSRSLPSRSLQEKRQQTNVRGSGIGICGNRWQLDAGSAMLGPYRGLMLALYVQPIARRAINLIWYSPWERKDFRPFVPAADRWQAAENYNPTRQRGISGQKSSEFSQGSVAR